MINSEEVLSLLDDFLLAVQNDESELGNTKDMISVRLSLIDGINYAHFLAMFFEKKRTELPMKVYEQKNKLLKNARKKLLEKYPNVFYLKGTGCCKYWNIKGEKAQDFIGYTKKIIDELGEKHKILNLMFMDAFYYKAKIDDDLFFKCKNDYFKQIIDNWEYINFTRSIYGAKKISWNHNKDLLEVINSFLSNRFEVLNVSNRLCKEFDITKKFYNDYLEKINNGIDEMPKGEYLSQYHLKIYKEDIVKKSRKLFGFDKLEKKILKDDNLLSEEDKEYLLKELYQIMDKEEIKVKNLAYFNINEKTFEKISNEIYVISETLNKKTSTITNLFMDKEIEHEDYKIVFNKINAGMFCCKIIDKSDNKLLLENESVIVDFINNKLGEIILAIQEDKGNWYPNQKIEKAEKVVENFLKDLEKEVRGLKLLKTMDNNQSIIKKKKI